ncbi:hypothetical protein J5N97_020480 [Dioscorea zingiberensis]|uniref:Uncharacterized protein n=1 Tax=Dioscorea zingiberensis TaxID=325984 RepID=A0A9D5CFY0_9LILI|nr:hypothetical protein J5N97_020480 [Dioscorea zingiberensis]
MKLFGWMHRKLWQTSGHNFANAPTSNCLFSGGTSPGDFNVFVSHASAKKEDSEDHGDILDPADVILSDGFLSIGTFGSLPILTLGNLKADQVLDDDLLCGSVTPAFGVPIKINTVKEETTAVSDELEKVLSGEANKATTLGAEENFTETKREKRASLGELFMRSRLEEEGGIDRASGAPPVTEKKMLTCIETSKPSTSMKRFRKVLQMFHRKVHPENMLGMPKSSKDIREEIKYKPPEEELVKNSGKSGLIDFGRACSKIDLSCFKCGLNTPPAPILDGANSCPRVNRERWIKTDAECEYLVS